MLADVCHRSPVRFRGRQAIQTWKEKGVYDIERIVAGFDEVNRKRTVINRVLSTLVSLMQGSGQRWEEGTTIFSVPVYELVPLSFVAGKHRFGGKDDVFVRFGPGLFVDFDAELNFNYRDVPVVYGALPAIIEAADAAVPKAGVRGFCSFFAKQAPNS